MPVARTTCSAWIVPFCVTTPVTRVPVIAKSVTGVPSKNRTPLARAPAASAIVASTGLARPSVGVQKPDTMPRVSISGNLSLISAGDSSNRSTPCERTKLASRFSTSRRVASQARWMWPHWRKPVESPVSDCRSMYSWRVYCSIQIRVSVDIPPEAISPAACHVVPEVSLSRSSSTTSRTPSLPR